MISRDEFLKTQNIPGLHLQLRLWTPLTAFIHQPLAAWILGSTQAGRIYIGFSEEFRNVHSHAHTMSFISLFYRNKRTNL